MPLTLLCARHVPAAAAEGNRHPDDSLYSGPGSKVSIAEESLSGNGICNAETYRLLQLGKVGQIIYGVARQEELHQRAARFMQRE